MTEKEWKNKLNGVLIDSGTGPVLIRNTLKKNWWIVCSFSDDRTCYHPHAYQAVNEWNEARRGEKL